MAFLAFLYDKWNRSCCRNFKKKVLFPSITRLYAVVVYVLVLNRQRHVPFLLLIVSPFCFQNSQAFIGCRSTSFKVRIILRLLSMLRMFFYCLTVRTVFLFEALKSLYMRHTITIVCFTPVHFGEKGSASLLQMKA